MAYRNIEDKIWTDPEFRKCDPNAKLVFLHLITCTHGHLGGIYYLPRYAIEHETGLDSNAVMRALDTLSIGHLAQYDHEREVVWVTNMMRYQGKGAKAIRSVSSQLERLHNSPLINDFLKYYKELRIPYRYPIDRASPQEAGIRKQKQEQEQGEEARARDAAPKAPPAPAGVPVPGFPPGLGPADLGPDYWPAIDTLTGPTPRQLAWLHTLASEASDARGVRVTVAEAAAGLTLTGTTVTIVADRLKELRRARPSPLSAADLRDQAMAICESEGEWELPR